MIYYIFNHHMRMQALKYGNFYVSKLSQEQRNMKKDEVIAQLENKEGI